MKSRADFLEHDEAEWENYLLFYYSPQILAGILANPLYAQIMGNSVNADEIARVTSVVATQQAQALIDVIKETMQANYQTRLKKAE
jgi:hypothetical protein